MAEVTLENVGKRYGSVVVVPNLDLKIADGEFACRTPLRIDVLPGALRVIAPGPV